MRVVIADDEALLREGLARLLDDAGFEVAGRCGDADALLRMVDARKPDVAIVDIRMPPNHGDDGLLAAQEIRRRHPDIGVLVLSHYLDSRYAARLLEEVPEGAGYLLKERVSEVAVVADALRRIDEGECVIDPTIVSRLVARKRERGPLDVLTEREREVLGLVAEGRSNGAIAEQLFLSKKTIDAHISQIFMKLDLRESPGGPPPRAGGAHDSLRALASSSASSHVVTYSIRTITPSRKVVTWWYSSFSISRPLPLPRTGGAAGWPRDPRRRRTPAGGAEARRTSRRAPPRSG